MYLVSHKTTNSERTAVSRDIACIFEIIYVILYIITVTYKMLENKNHYSSYKCCS